MYFHSLRNQIPIGQAASLNRVFPLPPHAFILMRPSPLSSQTWRNSCCPTQLLSTAKASMPTFLTLSLLSIMAVHIMRNTRWKSTPLLASETCFDLRGLPVYTCISGISVKRHILRGVEWEGRADAVAVGPGTDCVRPAPIVAIRSPPVSPQSPPSFSLPSVSPQSLLSLPHHSFFPFASHHDACVHHLLPDEDIRVLHTAGHQV